MVSSALRCCCRKKLNQDDLFVKLNGLVVIILLIFNVSKIIFSVSSNIYCSNVEFYNLTPTDAKFFFPLVITNLSDGGLIVISERMLIISVPVEALLAKVEETSQRDREKLKSRFSFQYIIRNSIFILQIHYLKILFLLSTINENKIDFLLLSFICFIFLRKK